MYQYVDRTYAVANVVSEILSYGQVTCFMLDILILVMIMVFRKYARFCDFIKAYRKVISKKKCCLSHLQVFKDI